MKVFITTKSEIYANWIDEIEIVDSITKADIVIFTGGPDVSPEIYGESKHHHLTNVNIHRDKVDQAFFLKAKAKNKFLIGVCRGAHFLSSMSGGKVIQHVNNHARKDGHEIKTIEGDVHFITSTHHQMMYPYSAKKYEILAVSSPMLSDCFFRNNIHVYPMVEEPEVVYYPETRALCIQGHPELMAKEEAVIEYLNKLIKNKFENE